MAYQELLFDVHETVATVTLNRPDKLNALNAGLQQDILDVCHEANHNDGIRALVWTGAGKGFCSGADLSTFLPSEKEPTWQQRLDEDGWVGRQARAVYGLDKPAIAAVNGVAAGAGMSLSLACDLRFGGESTRFKTVFIERSISPDTGLTYFLPRIVGVGNALDLILTSRTVGADEALRMGLLQRLVPDDQLVPSAQETAAQIAAHPPLAAMMSKRVVHRSLDHTFDDQVRYEFRSLDLARRAVNDAQEQMRAFMERRPGKYTGT